MQSHFWHSDLALSPSFSRDWSPFVPIGDLKSKYTATKGGAEQTDKKTAPKHAQQRVRETAAEERYLECFAAVFAKILATRPSGGSARLQQKSNQKAKAARKQEGKDTPENQRERE